MTESTMKHEFIWFDGETTGVLNHEPGGLYNGGQLLEWAVVLCRDAAGCDFGVEQEYTAAIRQDLDLLCMDPYVRDMHTTNGLLAACAVSAMTHDYCDEFLLDLCCELTGRKQPKNLTLAGDSVHFDLAWIGAFLPKFRSCLSHRVFDTSTLKRCGDSYVPGYVHPPKAASGSAEAEHRALADAHASIAAFKAWRLAVLGS
jgi:oligoribonuclease (3'-5' exoribonuclease)